MKVNEIQILIDKYLSGEASQEERMTVEHWYENVSGPDGEFSEQRLQALKSDMHQAVFSQLKKEALVVPLKASSRLLHYVGWVAAILVIGIGVGFYFYSSERSLPGKLASQLPNDIVPGGNKATLTLADGSTLALDGAGSGQLASQAGVAIRKNEDGLLSYQADQNSTGHTLVYNTISIPRGGKYRVILADGTKIWLNSATILKYPTEFSGDERKVELSGEAYFEVAKDPNKPFKVLSEGQTVEVLGTHFNINAYADEGHTSSTLLEGSIRISSGSQLAVLKPGQQSIIKPGPENNKAIQVNTNINTAEVIAWKDDLFQFEDADIKTVMNQIGRWYDVDVVYGNKIPEDHYTGKVSRNVNASQALKILEASGINFKIEGKKIIVN